MTTIIHVHQHNTRLQKTRQYMAQGLDTFGLNTSILHVCMYITTYDINSGYFIQEYGCSTLSVITTFLSVWLQLCTFNIVFVNCMCWSCMPLYYVSLRMVIYHRNMQERSCVWMICDLKYILCICWCIWMICTLN